MNQILISRSNGPLFNILRFCSPETILRRLVVVNKPFYETIWFMIQEKMFRWKSKELRMLFGGPDDEVRKPYCGEKQFVKFVDLVGLKRLPIVFGGMGIVSYGAKRGWSKVVEMQVEQLLRRNETPGKNVLTIAANSCLEEREYPMKIFALLLQNFASSLVVDDVVLLTILSRLDVESVRNMFESDPPEFKLTYERKKYVLPIIFPEKYDTPVKKERRNEIFAILIEHFCPFFDLTTLKEHFTKMGHDFTSHVFSMTSPSVLTLSIEDSETILRELWKTKNFALIQSILDIQLQNRGSTSSSPPEEIDQEEKSKILSESLRISPSMVTFCIRLKNEELLKEYLKLVEKEVRSSRNMTKFVIHLEDLLDEYKIKQRSEISGQFFEYIETVMKTGYFLIESSTLLAFVKNPKILDLLIRYPSHNETFLYGTGNSVKLFVQNYLESTEHPKTKKNREQQISYRVIFERTWNKRYFFDIVLSFLRQKRFEEIVTYVLSERFLLKRILRTNPRLIEEIFEVSTDSLDPKYSVAERIIEISSEMNPPPRILDEKTIIRVFNGSKGMRRKLIDLDDRILPLFDPKTNSVGVIVGLLSMGKSYFPYYYSQCEQLNESEKGRIRYFCNRIYGMGKAGKLRFEVNDSHINTSIDCEIDWVFYVRFVDHYVPRSFGALYPILNKDYENQYPKKYLFDLIKSCLRRKVWRDFYYLQIKDEKKRSEVIKHVHGDEYVIVCHLCKKRMNLADGDQKVYFCDRCSEWEDYSDEKTKIPVNSPNLFCGDCGVDCIKTKEVKVGKEAWEQQEVKYFLCKKCKR